MTTKRAASHYGSVCVAGFLMLAGIACQRRESSETSDSKDGAEPAAEASMAPEIVRVGKDFRILDALVREHRRLQAGAQTEDTRKKSDLLQAQIARLTDQLEAAQSEMNDEELQILASGRELTAPVDTPPPALSK